MTVNELLGIHINPENKRLESLNANRSSLRENSYDEKRKSLVRNSSESITK